MYISTELVTTQLCGLFAKAVWLKIVDNMITIRRNDIENCIGSKLDLVINVGVDPNLGVFVEVPSELVNKH